MTRLQFGKILNNKIDFIPADKSLQLSWQTDVPFFTHFIISSQNVLNEQGENSVKIAVNDSDYSFIDPLLDIDFGIRNYFIKGLIEYEGVEEIITETQVSFNASTYFEPKHLDIKVHNEQEWEVSWDNRAFFATNIEVIRYVNQQDDIIFNLPAGTTSFIDSILVADAADLNQFRRYQIRFLTETRASNGVEYFRGIEIAEPEILGSQYVQNNPNSITINWVGTGTHKNRAREYIVEKAYENSNRFFYEVGRVSGESSQFTDNNVSESDNPTYRVKTTTSMYSFPATFSFTSSYQQEYSFSAGMGYVTFMGTSSDKKYLAAVSFRSDAGNSILITDIESRQSVAQIQIPDEQISDFKISSNDDLIYFAVPTSRAIYKADFPTGNNIEKVISDASVNSVGVYHIDISNDGSFLIGTGGRGFVKKWNLNTYEPVFVIFEYHTPTFYSYKNIAISPDGNYIGGNNGRSYIMDAQNGVFLEDLISPSSNLWDIQFSPDGSHYAFVASNNMLYIYSTDSWELVSSISNIRRADFHPDEYVITLSGYQSIYTYNYKTSEILGIVTDQVGRAVLANDQNKLINIDADRIAIATNNQIQIWNKANAQKSWRKIN